MKIYDIQIHINLLPNISSNAKENLVCGRINFLLEFNLGVNCSFVYRPHCCNMSNVGVHTPNPFILLFSLTDVKSKESPYRMLRGRKRPRGELDRDVSSEIKCVTWPEL